MACLSKRTSPEYTCQPYQRLDEWENWWICFADVSGSNLGVGWKNEVYTRYDVVQGYGRVFFCRIGVGWSLGSTHACTHPPLPPHFTTHNGRCVPQLTEEMVEAAGQDEEEDSWADVIQLHIATCRCILLHMATYLSGYIWRLRHIIWHHLASLQASLMYDAEWYSMQPLAWMMSYETWSEWKVMIANVYECGINNMMPNDAFF